MKEQVQTLKQIIELLKNNRRTALKTLSALNKKLSDEESYHAAQNEILHLCAIGIISRRMREHMLYEISQIYGHDKYVSKIIDNPFDSYQNIVKYANAKVNWIIREVILFEAIGIEKTRDIDRAKYNIDAYFSEGDIPQNIVYAIKEWYDLIYAGKAENLRKTALLYGFEHN